MIEFAMQHPYLFTIILLAPITFVYDIIITYIDGKQDGKDKNNEEDRE